MVSLIWQHVACDEAKASELSAALRVDPLIARLLCTRGLEDPEAAARFLTPSIDQLHDPLLLRDLPAAVDRLLAAIARKERIAVHGDFDVDGITSTVILRRALELLGGNVTHFIPHRTRDGYGIQPVAVERLHADGARLIVSVDCGIRGQEAARRARELGVDLIITDHHEPGEVLPTALAVINPKRPDCRYPNKDLAGAGVALKVVQALCARTGREKWLPGFVKMAAIGTLADVVPLTGENRVIARIGLDGLTRGPNKVGIRALIETAGLSGRQIDAYQVAFLLAPRLNAAGRMSNPELAARLLLASDDAMEEEARLLAQQLSEENQRRQHEERSVTREARRMVETNPEIGALPVLVVAGESWHRGVIGIVASRLVETFHRPAIVLSIDGDIAYGSCRSIHAFDILDALERCSQHLLRFGGHRAAAGLALSAAGIKEFRAAVNTAAEETLTPDVLRPRLGIDAAVRLTGLSEELARKIEDLAPFGLGNPRPVFSTAGVEVVDGPRILKEAHLSMAVRQGRRTFRLVAWKAAPREAFFKQHRAALDLAFRTELNTFNGNTSLELSLADARPSEQHVDSVVAAG
jgi:single-stranded-DNA-specific exonuclease